MKLRTFLVAVVILAMVPLLGVAGFAIWWAHQDERRAMEQAMLLDDPSLGPEARDRIVQIYGAAERIREIVVDMNHLTRVQLFEHTCRGLPEMPDIRKSAGTPPPAP